MHLTDVNANTVVHKGVADVLLTGVVLFGAVSNSLG